jgi:hypothetical protein
VHYARQEIGAVNGQRDEPHSGALLGRWQTTLFSGGGQPLAGIVASGALNSIDQNEIELTSPIREYQATMPVAAVCLKFVESLGEVRRHRRRQGVEGMTAVPSNADGSHPSQPASPVSCNTARRSLDMVEHA